MGDIGRPVRHIEIEPIPETVPTETPVETPSEPEKVPA